VWALRGDRLEPVSVRVGITDGATTAILDGELTEGTLVVTGVSSSAAAAPAAASPLLPFGGRRAGGDARRAPTGAAGAR